jgi:bacillithiol synthase|tara:strand:+ start:40906 stop:42462 length:1557 start_codon:yes stop_codon:yes gene_type:complete
MKATHQSLHEVGSFSKMFLDYLSGNPSLSQFYAYEPKIEAFESAIKNRVFDGAKRTALAAAITKQYSGLEISDQIKKNLESLRSNHTFTVTTGHQLNIFTGPLYFIFKIVTTLNLAKKLNQAYPHCHFVPIYWMASEDHDFEEIDHFNLFGKKYTWETKQTGAVGRFDPSSLKAIIDSLPEKIELFEKAYGNFNTLSDSVRYYVNELFGAGGLIVLDADEPSLKAQFSSVIKDDIINQKANDLVEQTNLSLSQIGYSSQAFSRKINFFYLDAHRRRIIPEDGLFKVHGSNLTFSKSEMIAEIDSHPERFSPNVIMRPVYQEAILPNLAYLGGPAEIIYWLQLKGIFDHYSLNFPILMPRNFGMLVNRVTEKRMTKLDVHIKDLFQSKQALKASFIQKNSNNEHLLDLEKQDLKIVFDQIEKKARSINQSLIGFIGAESSKALKALENIEKRLLKGQETQNEIGLNQLEALKDKLFPGGVLQERHENFLNFYLNNPRFIQDLIDHFDPFDYIFYILWEE